MSSLFTTEHQTNIKRPKRKILMAIPIFLLIGTVTLFAFTGWEKFAPVTEVQVTKARISSSNNQVKEGKTLFQAAGWIHADPYPINATALISGIITKIHVIDGQQIKKGQLLAELNNEDVQIALLEAKSKLQEVILDVKQEELKIKTLESQITENLSFKKTALAIVETAKHKAEILKKSGIGITKFDKEQAAFELEEKKIHTEEFDQRIAVLKAEIEQQKSQVEISKAKVKIQEVKIARIKLDLSRCKIYAPESGIIQTLYARVGRKQMLNSDNELSTTVAKIFNPEQVLVVVDVPLNDLSKVKINQKARITLEAISDKLDAVVTSLHGEADYQKNTLQVHVSIPAGHPNIRPDMLAQVEFLADKPIDSIAKEKSGIFIDKRSLLDGQKVFVISLENRLKALSVETGEEKDGWIEILSGIHGGEKTVLNPTSHLKDGQLIKVGELHE
jgi:HlyD family secretion protein